MAASCCSATAVASASFGNVNFLKRQCCGSLARWKVGAGRTISSSEWPLATGFSGTISLTVPRSSSGPQSRQIRRDASRPGRRMMYEETNTYVLLEPGEDEVILDEAELRSRLKSWLVKWPSSELPVDLAQYASVDAMVDYLMSCACELDFGGGRGSLQWYEVRLE